MKRHALRRIAVAAALLCSPMAANADPGFVRIVGTFIGVVVGGPWGAAITVGANMGANVYGGIDARRRARREAARQRALYNASLNDRSVSALSATPPWRIVYGRAISGTDTVAIFTSDKTATREDGTTFTRPDALKHLVLVVATHEVEAIHEIYIDGVPIGALDGNGYPTGGAFSTSTPDSRTVSFNTTTTVPEVVSSIAAGYSIVGSGDAANYVPQTITLTPPSTLNGPPGVAVFCDYTFTNTLAAVRVQKHLGSATQTADSYLMGLLPSQWTSADRGQGIAYIVLTLDLEDTRFQGGPPQVTVDTSGRKVYDPRTGLTAWSANTALCTRDWLMAPWGYEVAAADMDDSSVIASANTCDSTISLTVGGSTTTGPTYTCNGSFTTDTSREAVLEDLVESMAGYAVEAGQWRVIAGTWTAPVMDLTDDDLFGQIEVVQADAAVDELLNGLRGTMIEAGKAQPSEIDPYQNPVFVAADGGVEMWSDISLPFTDNRARARNLARVFVERSRNGLIIRYPAKLRAWPLLAGERVTVTSAEFGFAAKTFRVTDRLFNITSPVLLTLQEDEPEAYDLADAATANTSPNTGLPDPWIVSAISGLAAASGTAQLERTADGTLRPRVLVTWTAVSDAYIADGSGRIELLWRRPGSALFRQVNLPGDATGGWIDQAKEGEPLFIEVRAVNGLGKRGASAFLSHTVVGKTALPDDVAGLAAAALPGGVGVTWTPNTEPDYAETEVRYGANWAAGTRIYLGPADRFTWPWPAAGSYTLRAKHRDTSGNESATDATLGVTVNNGNLIPTGGLQPGAATGISTDTHDFAGASAAGTTNAVERSFVVTPDVDCTVEFTSAITASFVLPDSGRGLYWAVAAGAGSDVILGSCNSDSSARQNFMCATSFAATGGVSLTFKLRSTYAGAGAVQLLYESSMRVTEIRR